MKQIQYILCVTLCVVSSVYLWSATSAGAGVGGGAGGGHLDDSAHHVIAADLEEFERRLSPPPYSSLVDTFFMDMETAYLQAVTKYQFNYSPKHGIQSIPEAYKTFKQGAETRVGSAPKTRSESHRLDAILKELAIEYKAQYKSFCSRNAVIFEHVKTSPLEVAINQKVKDVFTTILKKIEGDINALANQVWKRVQIQDFVDGRQKRAYDLDKIVSATESARKERERHEAWKDVQSRVSLENEQLTFQAELKTKVEDKKQQAKTSRDCAVQKARDTAHAVRHAQLIQAGKWMLVAAALSAVGGMGAYFGFRHFFKERPKIIRPQDTSISFGLKKAKYPPSRLDKLILPPALQKSVMQKFQGMEFAITKGLPLSNMLFYGPPGVGKSLAAQEFVRSLSDKKLAHHIIIRGPAFQQFKRPGQAVSAIRAIFEAAEHSYKKTKKPTIIDFEEAEILFADRGNPAISTEMSRSTLTTLLGLMNESVSKHIVFIATTNHKNDLDPAFRDRTHISNQILFDVPGQEEREIFLRQYLNDVLVEQGFVVSDEVTNAIPVLAKSLSGLSGRQISGMITQAIYPLLNAGEFELTLPLFKEIIEDTMANKDSL